MQSPTGWLLWRLGKGLKHPHTHTHMFELFSNEMPRRWGRQRGGTLPLSPFSLSQGALQNCILLHVRLILPRTPEPSQGAKSHSPLLNGEFMFIFTNRWTYISDCECVCESVCVRVAHVAEPQGVGELLASNWNCRFNILNYRLANGQYFVTTLQCHTLLFLSFLSLPSHCPAWSSHRSLHAHIKLCHINCIAINNQLLCVFPVLDSRFSTVHSSPFSVPSPHDNFNLGGATSQGECDCFWYSIVYEKLFLVLL